MALNYVTKVMTKKVVFVILFISLIVPYFSFSQLSYRHKRILREELSGLINDLRKSEGLEPLISNDTLIKAAEFHSEYMARYNDLSHEQKFRKYRTPKKRVLKFDGDVFLTIGENILHTTPQFIPKKKKEVIALAQEMFNSWKNSPGHYANMVTPEYVYAGLGFKRDPNKNIIYATQVFGIKGHKVPNQISENSYKLRKDPLNCKEEFEKYSDQILFMGNRLRIEGNKVMLYYHDIKKFKELFSGTNNGIAIDLITQEQFPCGKSNQLDPSPVHDGILLKPFYGKEMIINNQAQGDYRLITQVGEIPKNLMGNEYSLSLVIVKGKRSCRSVYPFEIPYTDYELHSFSPIVRDESSTKLVKKGVLHTQNVVFNFKRNDTYAMDDPKIEKYPNAIHSVHINSFSSVEGNSTNNVRLHNLRAKYIKSEIQSRLGVASHKFTSTSKENWEQMDFQLQYYGLNSLSQLSEDTLKSFLSARNDSLAWDALTKTNPLWRSISWDSLLLSQRRSNAIINYTSDFTEGGESLGEFNLRTAVATRNDLLANKALYEMYQSADYNASILFEPQIIDFMKTHPKTVGNYAALLSKNYENSPYKVTEYISVWLNNLESLDETDRNNLMHLYTRVCSLLLDRWDVSSARLSYVIRPSRIQKITLKDPKPELVLNQHLIFIAYYGQINSTRNIGKSFRYIADYLKENAISQYDDVKLCLFFNKWGAYNLTVDYLLHRFKNENISENGLFLLAQTMNLIDIFEQPKDYFEVNERAIQDNTERWCNWVDRNFQVKRNYRMKRMYCEACR